MKRKRLYSFFLALVLIVSQPFIMFSSASNLASSETGNVGDADNFYTASGSVDGHVGFSAYLGMSGIYLKADADVSLFQDVSLGLDSLWDDFKEDVGDVAGNLADLGGSVVRGGLAFSRKSWNTYSRFANWIKDKFGLGDNQQNIVPSEPGEPPLIAANILTTEWMEIGSYCYLSQWSYFGHSYVRLKSNASLSGDVYVYLKYREPGYQSSGETSLYLMFYNDSDVSISGHPFEFRVSDNYHGTVIQDVYLSSVLNAHYATSSSNLTVYTKYNNVVYGVNPSLPVIPYNGGYVPDPDPEPEPTEEPPIKFDTGVISIPAEIPEDAEGGDSMGGILFPAIGSGLGGAAGAIAGTIIDGVMGGVMPDIDIRPADVKIPPDMEIDDDGNVFPTDLEFKPTDVFLDSDAYKLDMLTNYFPFSIPWDLLQFAAMFRAEPEVPVMEFVLPMPEGIDDIVINVDLTPFEPVAALSRSGLFVLFAIRWLMFLYRKFG